MNKKKLALFLGMLCGDDCLVIRTKSKGGYKCYSTDFCNSDLNLMNNFQDLFLKGFIITDGSIRKSGNAVFHIASKKFLEDISHMVYELFGIRKQIKGYVQKGKYLSYQLLLNKKEAQIVLNS